MTVYIDPADHAFASGQVFLRPSSRSEAVKMVGEENAARLLAVWAQFAEHAEIGQNVRLGLGARIVSENPARTVFLGDNAIVRGILRCERGGRLKIGEFVYVGDNVIISAQNSIEIGELTLIGHGAQIFDNDSHPVPADQREAQFKRMLGIKTPVAWSVAAAPVSIGRRCWLGFNTAVMKGVTMGPDSIAAAGAVVTVDVPSACVVAGNPARIVKNLNESPAQT